MLLGTHLEGAAAEEAVDTVEVDDEGDPFSVLVQIALEFRRVVVHLAAHQLGRLHASAAPECHEGFRLGTEYSSGRPSGETYATLIILPWARAVLTVSFSAGGSFSSVSTGGVC
jgi:hypothetical protein